MTSDAYKRGLEVASAHLARKPMSSEEHYMKQMSDAVLRTPRFRPYEPAPAIAFVKLHELAQLPTYGTDEAAGADIRSVEHVTIDPRDWKVVKTGLGCAIQPGYEIQVRPRSGLAAKHGVTVLNAPGTIDSDYTGEIGVILINHGPDPFIVKPGDRIAQIVPAQVLRFSYGYTWADQGRDTDRGAGGYGSTGR